MPFKFFKSLKPPFTHFKSLQSPVKPLDFFQAVQAAKARNISTLVVGVLVVVILARNNSG